MRRTGFPLRLVNRVCALFPGKTFGYQALRLLLRGSGFSYDRLDSLRPAPGESMSANPLNRFVQPDRDGLDHSPAASSRPSRRVVFQSNARKG